MFEAGRANTLIELQDPNGAVDALGAPEFGWVSQVPPLTLYAYPENEIVAVDSMATGPREESIRAVTFVTRNHPGLNINTRQRIVDLTTGLPYRILGIRYDAKHTQCFIDSQSGEARG